MNRPDLSFTVTKMVMKLHELRSKVKQVRRLRSIQLCQQVGNLSPANQFQQQSWLLLLEFQNVVVLIKHQTIIVKPGEKAPTGKVPGNPSTTYEKMESLTKEITRTITVKLPDGQRQIITQTVKFTRTATFDAVTGKVTYSGWQVDGNDE